MTKLNNVTQMTNPNDTAFPEDVSGTREYTDIKGGLTKREYFATMAMQGIMSNGVLSKFLGQEAELSGRLIEHTVAILSKRCADALINELNK